MFNIKFSREGAMVYSKQASQILGKNYWYLRDDVKVRIEFKSLVWSFIIPQGYLTDGATVPRLAWSIVPLWDECTNAVLLHDYLCNYSVTSTDGELYPLNRENIDLLFLRTMEFYGVHWFKRKLMYGCVRLWAKLFKYEKPMISTKKHEMEEMIRENIRLGYY